MVQDRKSTRLNSSHLGIAYAVFFLNDPATTEIYTLSLHDALPICPRKHPKPVGHRLACHPLGSRALLAGWSRVHPLFTWAKNVNRRGGPGFPLSAARRGR